MMTDRFFKDGYARFAFDPLLSDWIMQVKSAALATRHDPALIRDWLRGAGTWFVGVNALGNDGQGCVGNSGPLRGQAIGFVRKTLGFGQGGLDRAQVSICYPGFPKRMQAESDAAFAFRQNRDAAHVDGLHPTGPQRQRRLEEFSGFLLGIPITDTGRGAAPLVVWQGSHKIMAQMFHQQLAAVPVENWPEIDLTQPYQRARKQVFETCIRKILHAKPGESYVLHRMALHGVAPWQTDAIAPSEGRAVLYFRPEIDRADWLGQP